jgi:cell division initiation protein
MSDEAPDLVLGPDEIVNYPLRKATRGYAVAEVDDLLDQLAVQTQDLLARLREAEDERDRLRDELSEASEAESVLKRTLVTAQRAAEASVSEARDEAEELRARARRRVEEVIREAADQAHELREKTLRRARADEADMRRHRRDVEAHVDQLRQFAEDHRARLTHHLELQRERLGELELPPPPQPPSLPEDDVLDVEVDAVDVEGMVRELTGDQDEDGAAAEVDDDRDGGAQDAVPAVDEPDDGQPADRGTDDAEQTDGAERLFGR